jgi:hypothetical protein
VNFRLQNPFWVFGLVFLWRVALLVFTAQPVPTNDAAFFDGAMVNWSLHGHYINPSLSVVFPISGHQVYAAYPPLYQGALWVWMKLFGTTVISAMALHVALFAISGFLVVRVVQQIFPGATNYALVPLLLFAVTFDDRPEGLAHNFGLLSLLLVARLISAGANRRLVLGIALALFCALYTSVVVGALYFAIGSMAVVAAGVRRRTCVSLGPFALAAVLFAVTTITIAKVQPLWWAGFKENARQTPVLAVGFRVPTVQELLKLIRAAPVFLLAVALIPLLVARRKQILGADGCWLALVIGVFVTGWGLLVASMTLLTANYVGYVLFVQLLLAAGLLALGEHLPVRPRRWLRVALTGCVVLVSVRAAGLTTWGVACAWKNSYARTHQTLLVEFAPFAHRNSAVVVSSAFVYAALEAGVRNPVHSDWYFDRANWTNNADINGLVALQPKKLVLAQFDYYRVFVPLLEQLRARPGLVDITVRDQAAVRTPDSIPALQRVLQQVSWAPVLVDLEWKGARP